MGTARAFMMIVCLSLVAWATTAHAQTETTSPAPILQPKPSAAASGQTPVSKDQANAFYIQCVGNSLSLNQLNPEQKEYLCSCVANGMTQSLTVNDVRQMRETKSQAGRLALAKMLEKVYFPCAMKPIEDSVTTECERRAAANQQFAAGGQKYCSCLSGKMMSYVQKVGIPETLYKLLSNGEVSEPFDALTGSGGYSQELVRNYYSCFGGVLP